MGRGGRRRDKLYYIFKDIRGKNCEKGKNQYFWILDAYKLWNG